jgi:hypothetical protein
MLEKNKCVNDQKTIDDLTAILLKTDIPPLLKTTMIKEIINHVNLILNGILINKKQITKDL